MQQIHSACCDGRECPDDLDRPVIVHPIALNGAICHHECMNIFYNDYVWIKGVPTGVGRIDSNILDQKPLTYKIITDPYRKRFTVEVYHYGKFAALAYDSLLLDFRHLKPAEQQGWQKVIWKQKEDEVTCLIRNQDDRTLYVETNYFKDNVCRQCDIHSPHGIKLSTHRMSYTHLGDPFDGVVLYDSNDHVVMRKKYACSESGEFGDLLEESWDIR